MKNIDYIKLAGNKITKQSVKGGICGDVASLVESESGKFYYGICADIGSNCHCAEQVALGAMITDGEYRFKKIVAVWKDDNGELYVIPPCGNCRQFMRELGEENLGSDIILDINKTVILKDLLPYYDWWKKVE